MLRNREAAHGSKQARHQLSWQDKHSTMPLTDGMTYGQIAQTAVYCALFVGFWMAVCHITALICGVI